MIDNPPAPLRSDWPVPRRGALTALHVASALAIAGGALGCGGEIEGEVGANPYLSPNGVTTLPLIFQLEPSGPSEFGGARMLTRAELAATLRDLTGLDVDVSQLPEEDKLHNLSNDAGWLLAKDGQHLASLYRIANDVAVRLDLNKVLPCGSACADQDLETFLRRAFRRRLTNQETEAYAQVYAQAKAGADHDFARRAVVQSALISPNFLYRTEIGDEDGELTSSELAAKLSYFLWGSMPDAPLLSLALSGELKEAETYASEVQRLLDDPRHTDRLVAFVFEWLGLDHFDLATKAGSEELPASLQASMVAEVERMVEQVLLVEGDGLHALFASERTWIDGQLATHYGLEPSATGEAVSLAGTQRRGILTTALALAAHGKEGGRSPMQRGHFLIGTVMCHGFTPEAGAVSMELPPNKDNKSFKEQFVPLAVTEPCSNCHASLNAGFALDIFDEVGRRYPPDVVPLEEAAGFFALPPAQTLGFATTVEAVQGFSTHPALPQCFVGQSLRYAQGRMPSELDATVAANLAAAFEASDQNVPDLWLGIAMSTRFRQGVQAR